MPKRASNKVSTTMAIDGEVSSETDVISSTNNFVKKAKSSGDSECDFINNEDVEMKQVEEENGSPCENNCTSTQAEEQDLSTPTILEDNKPTVINDINNEQTDGGDVKIDKEEIDSVIVSSTNGPVINNFSMPSLTKRNVTLQMLLAAGILKPGDGNMSLDYHGQKFLGDLLENGQIRSQETSQIFSSPSSWAIACKQIINPDKIQRKSGCGWAQLKYKSLKLDYYKTVWFKRLREGAIDIKNISNGASSSDSEEEDVIHCVLKFGEHFEANPAYLSAQEMGSKVLISCSNFKDISRYQPYYVKISAEALAIADFHCNITNTETVGYISGHWNGDQNCIKLEVVHPCLVLMPNSTSLECDNERNRIALNIQKMGHEVVGWYHSHPRAPAQPSKDDISRQVMMKGAGVSESSYIPCVGVIISPLCYSRQQDLKRSVVQCFCVIPPPENRPMDCGRPMNIEYDTYSSTNFDTKKILHQMTSLIDYYKGVTDVIDINDMGPAKFDKLKETITKWIPIADDEFWNEVQHLFASIAVPDADTKEEINPDNSKLELTESLPVNECKSSSSSVSSNHGSSSTPCNSATSTPTPCSSSSAAPLKEELMDTD